MSKIQMNKNGTRNIDSKAFGIWSVEVTDDVDWIDVENKIYDEVYFRTKKIFGIPIYDRKFIVRHRIPEKKSSVGFQAQKLKDVE